VIVCLGPEEELTAESVAATVADSVMNERPVAQTIDEANTQVAKLLEEVKCLWEQAAKLEARLGQDSSTHCVGRPPVCSRSPR